MRRSFSLEYWVDEGWYVGRLKEVPGVFSQGQSLDELEDNIRDAYRAMASEELSPAPAGAQIKDVEVEVRSASALFATSKTPGAVYSGMAAGTMCTSTRPMDAKPPVPRHREISESLCRLIQRQLGLI